MFSFKSIELFIMLIVAIIMLVARSTVANSCLSNGHTCKMDGSMGNCCSGFCYHQRHWPSGYCIKKNSISVL